MKQMFVFLGKYVSSILTISWSILANRLGETNSLSLLALLSFSYGLINSTVFGLKDIAAFSPNSAVAHKNPDLYRKRFIILAAIIASSLVYAISKQSPAGCYLTIAAFFCFNVISSLEQCYTSSFVSGWQVISRKMFIFAQSLLVVNCTLLAYCFANPHYGFVKPIFAGTLILAPASFYLIPSSSANDLLVPIKTCLAKSSPNHIAGFLTNWFKERKGFYTFSSMCQFPGNIQYLLMLWATPGEQTANLWFLYSLSNAALPLFTRLRLGRHMIKRFKHLADNNIFMSLLYVAIVLSLFFSFSVVSSAKITLSSLALLALCSLINLWTTYACIGYMQNFDFKSSECTIRAMNSASVIPQLLIALASVALFLNLSTSVDLQLGMLGLAQLNIGFAFVVGNNMAAQYK